MDDKTMMTNPLELTLEDLLRVGRETYKAKLAEIEQSRQETEAAKQKADEDALVEFIKDVRNLLPAVIHPYIDYQPTTFSRHNYKNEVVIQLQDCAPIYVTFTHFNYHEHWRLDNGDNPYEIPEVLEGGWDEWDDVEYLPGWSQRRKFQYKDLLLAVGVAQEVYQQYLDAIEKHKDKAVEHKKEMAERAKEKAEKLPKTETLQDHLDHWFMKMFYDAMREAGLL